MRLSSLDVDRYLAEKPMAITMPGLEELRGHIIARITAFDAAPRAFLDTLAETMAARATPQRGRPAGNAVSSSGVIPIRGTISQHSQGDMSSFLFGGATTEDIASELDTMLADDSISKIVLDIDSPGGVSYGVTELANKILASRGTKPIVAVANSLAASAAYWIGSAADSFYASPGALVGSIGVYAMHQDISKMAEDAGVKTTFISAGKHKVDGNQFEPLSDDARAAIQARVDDTYGMFIRDVANGRGVSEATVKTDFGEGDVFTAKRAKAAGMIDGILTLEEVLAKTFKAPTASGGMAAESVGAEGEPDEEEAPTEEIDSAGAERLARMRLKTFQHRASAANAV